jgi:hypothetical protein
MNSGTDASGLTLCVERRVGEPDPTPIKSGESPPRCVRGTARFGTTPRRCRLLLAVANLTVKTNIRTVRCVTLGRARDSPTMQPGARGRKPLLAMRVAPLSKTTQLAAEPRIVLARWCRNCWIWAVWTGSLRACKRGWCRDRGNARAGQAMRAGCVIPRC